MSYVSCLRRVATITEQLLSQAWIAALTKYPQQSYVQLLNTIRDELKGRYDQKPQLSASHRELLS